ncbi:MAG TPA: hypothetical protein VMB51_01095 [Solirubrobacteraceae bacterium]|nr:hypothetical protein [Solirubrobacteraceae bacterium]
MANPYHHALSSQRRWGGKVGDYLAIHSWFDESKEHHGDFRHRALRHHTQGIFEAERVFGQTITLSSGRAIPTRWIAEQHVIEDCGRIPSLSDWLSRIHPQPWMNRPRRLAHEFDRHAACHDRDDRQAAGGG